MRADISRLPFSSGSVDAVHAGAALHCWPSPSNAVRILSCRSYSIIRFPTSGHNPLNSIRLQNITVESMNSSHYFRNWSSLLKPAYVIEIILSFSLHALPQFVLVLGPLKGSDQSLLFTIVIMDSNHMEQYTLSCLKQWQILMANRYFHTSSWLTHSF